MVVNLISKLEMFCLNEISSSNWVKYFFLTGCIKYLIGYLKTEKSWIENMTFAKCKMCE